MAIHPEPVPPHIPAGIMISSRRHEPGQRRAEVLCAGGVWRPAEILAWARCQAGWAVFLRWPDGSEDWRLFAREHIRPL
jgi:hypothetical protein